MPGRRRFFALLIVLACAIATVAVAAEFDPFPDHDRVTPEDWQFYFDSVKTELGATERSFPERQMVQFVDNDAQTVFWFTQPGNPAHPAWITEKLISDNGSWKVDRIGHFAGDEAPFAELFKSFRRRRTSQP